ncbi:DUF305 domain-containing protein [Streptomyces flavofungini]|uniref:DUF305 domain-containing protein n=1 Tax=Streptomyces flavofungini TaxID=68200 RepID=A0ABS0XDK6_9ACTN|nr:DUF305 domain-containing protein [Streptomyces flavofungini]MBJ3811289.1 DUF305 domain-containing protein [Streptomyces flavofungini]GHC66342.1 DUF305 domain-containing protein [Streptomyces flavofungini]
MKRRDWLIGAVAGAVLAAGGITAAVASDSSGSSDADGSGDAPSTSSADAGFARDMAVHHQQAVEMSYVIRDRTGNKEIRRLAYDIAQTQANQRGMMLGWLDLWDLPKVPPGEPMEWMDMTGVPSAGDGSLMPGMATNAQMKRLGELNGKQAEIFYLKLMTAHHKGGIHMAQGCVERCDVPVERRLAQGMVESQESEVKLMADLLKARGAKP